MSANIYPYKCDRNKRVCLTSAVWLVLKNDEELMRLFWIETDGFEWLEICCPSVIQFCLLTQMKEKLSFEGHRFSFSCIGFIQLNVILAPNVPMLIIQNPAFEELEHQLISN